MQDFLAGRSAGDLLVVYLSCHGLLDARNRLYFAAADTRKSHLAATGIEAEWLIERLDECRARRQVLILDCCFSGAFAASAKGGDDLELERHVVGHGRGRVVLTASRAREHSFEGHALPGAAIDGSVFTAGLIDGLRTGGADGDSDGLVSVEDAYDYAYTYVQSRGANQTPQRWIYGAEGRIWLARNPVGPTPEPAPLPADIRVALESQYPDLRISAVNVLGSWLGDSDPARVMSARIALEHAVDHDIPRVALAARVYLEPAAPGATSQAAAPVWIYEHLREAEAAGRVPLRTLAGSSNWIRAIAFSRDGSLVAAAEHSTTVRVYNPRTGRVVGGPKHSFIGSTPAVVFASDGTLLATTGDDEAVRMWDPHTGQLVEQPLASVAKPVRNVVFSPNASMLAIADASGIVQLRDPYTGRAAGPPLNEDVDMDRQLQGMTFSPDASLLALIHPYGRIRLCDTRTAQTVAQLTIDYLGPGGEMAFSPDFSVFATTGQDVQLWDPRTGREIGRLATGAAKAVAFSADSSLLAVSADRGVQLWDFRTGQAIGQSLEDVGGVSYGMAFSPDGTLLAVANQAKAVQLWQLGA